jgi:hypothetical protein
VRALILEIEGKKYQLEVQTNDSYVSPGIKVAFCEELASDYKPILFDPRDHGSIPFPPELLAYRLVIDRERQSLCILYEVYWKRQDCSIREFNKDHDHDYEQIQIHFNLKTGKKEKVVVSSVGPWENGGHGIEIFSHVFKAKVRTVLYVTSDKGVFPWGGNSGQNNATQVREIPIEKLVFKNGNPAVLVVNCYHAFAGLKRQLLPEEQKELKPELVCLDQKLLDKWYYRHTKNRFGHDISKPFNEPHIMYYPPPEDWLSKLFYGFLWIFSVLKRALNF